MKKEIIGIPKSIKYLSEFIQDLPYNCILDKGKIGAGGTSVAIRNEENYIIAVPFLSLIENKVAQNDNLLGVYGKVKDKTIKDYLSKPGIKKIMVTYDSLCRLMEFINPSEFRLLVDEYHLLFTSYSFRHDACLCVLENYTHFKSYCFMTATVLEDDFILNELNHIPIIEYVWENVQEVTIHSMRCSHSVVPTVANIITQFLDGKIEGNAYFFVNSVEFIAEMVKLLKLTDENTRAIWSVYNKFKVGLTNKTTKNIPEDIRKINFFTSKCFEGVDLYDKNAKIYVISDKSKSHTLVDISTSIQQISGRVRNSKYLKDIAHIFTTTRYDIELSYDEYKDTTFKLKDTSVKIVQEYNNLSEEAKQGITKLSKTNYVNKRNNMFIFDENMVKIDLYNYKITKCLYRLRVNLNEEYQKNNFNVIEHNSLIKERFVMSNFFKDVVIECKLGDSDYLLWAFKKYDFLHNAIKYLGYDKIESYDYNIARIKRALIAFSDKDKEIKIKGLLNEYDLSKGIFVSNERLKEIFSEIYKDLNLNKTPKAKDIENYYKIKTTLKIIKGIRTNGVTIL